MTLYVAVAYWSMIAVSCEEARGTKEEAHIPAAVGAPRERVAEVHVRVSDVCLTGEDDPAGDDDEYQDDDLG